MQIAERLIRFLAHWIAEELSAREWSRFVDFSFSQQPSDFRQLLAGAGADVIVRLPFPQSVFIELNALIRDPAEHHRAHSAVAHGQSIGPLLGRLAVPELESLCLGGEGAAG